MRVLLATSPFGKAGDEPLRRLRETGWDVVGNPYGRRLRANEVPNLLAGIDAVIAGTEPYTVETLAEATGLKAICRVGIGLDSVDLDYCRKRGIQVTYTPDAPSDAVAELTVANILSLIRHVPESDRSVREGAWNRLMGRLVREIVVGVVGVGRIGSRVIHLLSAFSGRILACDANPAVHGRSLPAVTWCSMDQLFAQADAVTVHIPMCEANRHLVDQDRLAQMKTGSLLINTSRGPIVDEPALVDALRQRHLGGAALDVFEKEPYSGPLTRLDNVILTAHIGASARRSRFLMELGAAQDCIRVLNGEAPRNSALSAEGAGT